MICSRLIQFGRLRRGGLARLQAYSNYASSTTPRSRLMSTVSTHVVQDATKSSTSSRPVAYWLLGMSGLVAGMVTVGGITRLTRSGLSMTDWKLQGSLPPISVAEWEVEFERYKQYPEWQQRQSMTLDEFKFIYFWEYGHRMMGRSLGFAFAIPALYFAARGRIPKHIYPRLGLLFGLGGTQGLIGWWMVRSGLNKDPTQKQEIRVSPYRLATHLSMAFTTYVLLLWTGLDVLQHANGTTGNKMTADLLKYSKRLRGMAIVSGALAATTVLSGAFVAGNDAGCAYNTFPLMDGQIAPVADMFTLDPVWRNFFENTATVQFDHRALALSTLGLIGTLYASAVRSVHWPALPAATRRACHLAAGMAVAQVGLGISTLLLYVPLELAAMHQAGSLVLLSFLTALTHSLKFAATPHGIPGGSSVVTAATVAMATTAGAAAAAAATTASAKVLKPSTVKGGGGAAAAAAASTATSTYMAKRSMGLKGTAATGINKRNYSSNRSMMMMYNKHQKEWR